MDDFYCEMKWILDKIEIESSTSSKIEYSSNRITFKQRLKRTLFYSELMLRAVIVPFSPISLSLDKVEWMHYSTPRESTYIVGLLDNYSTDFRDYNNEVMNEFDNLSPELKTLVLTHVSEGGVTGQNVID